MKNKLYQIIILSSLYIINNNGSDELTQNNNEKEKYKSRFISLEGISLKHRKKNYLKKMRKILKKRAHLKLLHIRYHQTILQS
jgi:hypothetical protein